METGARGRRGALGGSAVEPCKPDLGLLCLACVVDIVQNRCMANGQQNTGNTHNNIEKNQFSRQRSFYIGCACPTLSSEQNCASLQTAALTPLRARRSALANLATITQHYSCNLLSRKFSKYVDISVLGFLFLAVVHLAVDVVLNHPSNELHFAFVIVFVVGVVISS